MKLLCSTVISMNVLTVLSRIFEAMTSSLVELLLSLVVTLSKSSLLSSRDHVLRLLVLPFSVLICGIPLQFYISLKICASILAMMLSANLQSGSLELAMETLQINLTISLCLITSTHQKTQFSLLLTQFILDLQQLHSLMTILQIALCFAAAMMMSMN